MFGIDDWHRRITGHCGLVLLFLSAPPADAHPHSWIDVRVEVMLDSNGAISGLELYWLFDEWYTVYIAEEFTESALAPTEYLNSLARQNLANLAEYDYFTKVMINGDPVGIKDVTTFDTGLSDERLWLTFDVLLDRPVDPQAQTVSYKVYDPTYYIEILHIEENPVTFSGAGAHDCAAEVVDANPGFEAVALASALDITQTGGDHLGELFAQTVKVSCR
ncbi:MAG: DUF1007 family protein [Geminicoccaceae bacterium]|nr:DUF1007 family protein [Geminicoccaceae bacterium]